MKDRLDILVIEDTQSHQESAREQFKKHNLALAKNYLEGRKLIESNDYNVVLTDLMMPYGGRETMGPEGMKYIFDLSPFGFPLALLAAKRGVHYIAVVTDISHHSHPLSAAIDSITEVRYKISAHSESSSYDHFSNLKIFHAPFTEDHKKNWNRVLEILLK